MEFTIRPAKREDCPAMLELIRELAAFERAPDEVTVSEAHFEESGFGENPVWWAFVACAPAQQAVAEEAAASVSLSAEAGAQVVVQDPLLANLLQRPEQAATGETLETKDTANGLPVVPPVIQLEEPVEPVIPEPVLNAQPLTAASQPCERVIGFALYYIRYSTWKGRRMYLEDLIVTESCRGKGVGTALMDALIGAARVESFPGISWQVLTWNEPAIKFYERYGARFDAEWTNASLDFTPR
jgi:ribosomal protein S18 acetylase RimI-like enzyme